MFLKKIMPRCISKAIKVFLNKKRFSDSTIMTSAIAKNVDIKENCSIGENVNIGTSVSIDKYSYINANSMIGSQTRIGRFCSIAYDCKIGMQEHPIDYISTSPYIYGIKNIFESSQKWEDYQNETVIGNDVWIGSNVVVIQGINIGNGAIVGAGAVVTKDVEPYTIVAGVPAKIIKKRFDPVTITNLQNIQWWNWDKTKIKENEGMFLSKDDWIKYI